MQLQRLVHLPWTAGSRLVSWIFLAVVALDGGAGATQGAPCSPDWISTGGTSPGANNQVNAAASFDDGSGSGSRLYVGGNFSSIGGAPIRYVACWDGDAWQPLGAGLNGAVKDLQVFDDGSGPALFACGEFQLSGSTVLHQIAKWQAGQWWPLGSGLGSVFFAFGNDLEVFDSGAGPELLVCGLFEFAGGLPVSNVARWNGSQWSAFVTSGGPFGFSMAVVEPGGGAAPGLYVGGEYYPPGGGPTRGVVRWDGAQWQPVGDLGARVVDLEVLKDPNGTSRLCAGGRFGTGPAPVPSLYAWDGSSWQTIAGGTNGQVRALLVEDQGTGQPQRLYALGDFTQWGGVPIVGLGYIEGTASPKALGIDAEVYSTGPSDFGVLLRYSLPGQSLLVVGSFLAGFGDSTIKNLAAWDGSGWFGFGDGLDAPVRALTRFDDGGLSGPALIAAGDMGAAGKIPLAGVARSTPNGWLPLGQGIDGKVRALIVLPTAQGPRLIAGGEFDLPGQLYAHVAQWDGSAWQGLGPGFGGPVNALEVYDAGQGPRLYAAGQFQTIGTQVVNSIAGWDGQAWQRLGPASAPGINNQVFALRAWDPGDGPRLYIGGVFGFASTVKAAQIVSWDGSQFSAMQGGIDGGCWALEVHDDGSGEQLYVGGGLVSAGGFPMNRITRWNGSQWSTVGLGFDDRVSALHSGLDSAGQPRLFAGGRFQTAEGLPAGRLASWDGQHWTAPSVGLPAEVLALESFDAQDGAGPGLYAGGLFGESPAGDSYFARLGCPPESQLTSVPGCFPSATVLTSPQSLIAVNQPFSANLTSQALTGMAVLFAGLPAWDAAGCGQLLPGVGELLIWWPNLPIQLASAPTLAGVSSFALALPNQPSLIGKLIALQALELPTSNPAAFELSNALRAQIQP